MSDGMNLLAEENGDAGEACLNSLAKMVFKKCLPGIVFSNGVTFAADLKLYIFTFIKHVFHFISYISIIALEFALTGQSTSMACTLKPAKEAYG